jgi:hypothetical protein
MGAPRPLAPKPVPVKRLSPFSPERNQAPPVGVPVNLLTVPSWRTIAELVALKHGFTLRDVVGESRARPIVNARHEAIGAVYVHTTMSLPAIGRRFNRDHTSALHAVRRSGVPLRPSGFDWTPEADDTVRRRWAEGRIIRHIAEELGTTFATVAGRVTKLDLPRRAGPPGQHRKKANWRVVSAQKRERAAFRQLARAL